MSIRAGVGLALRVVALAALYFVCFAGVSALLLPPPAGENAAGASAAAAALLAVSALNAAVIAYVVRHSRWSGWTLAAAMFVVLYGVVTVMPQIESAFFLTRTRLPAGLLPRLFLSGAVIAALVAPLAVLVLGRWKRGDAAESDAGLRLSLGEWVVRLAIVVVAYVALYFGFGYYVAWKSEAVRAYYGGVDPGGFVAQFGSVVRDTPWLVPLQVLRALLWAAIALPVIRMTTGPWWRAGLAVALLFSVVMNSQLLLPNPYMPRDVRMTHLVETASSNFIFGWVLVAVLRRRRTRTAFDSSLVASAS